MKRNIIIGTILFTWAIFFKISFASHITYKRYLKLSKAKQLLLIKKYVRKEEGWWVVSTYKYKVKTDVSPEIAIKYAIFMSDFYRKFSQIFKGGFKIKRQPILIIVQKDRFIEFLRKKYKWNPPKNIGGVYMPFYKVLVVPNQKEKYLCRTIQHEATHQLLHYYTGKQNIPLWFNEGTATNFEEWNLEKSVKENLSKSYKRFSRFPVLKKAVKEGTLIPFRELFEFSSKEWREGGELDELKYAEAWFSVYFLLTNKKGRTFFIKIVNSLRKGKDIKSLLSPSTKDRLAKALTNYLYKVIH